MMMGISTFQENPGTAAAGKRENEESGDGSVSGVVGEEEKARREEGDRNSAGNRWPREETLALLKIRSDMDVAFRDSPLKAPLWEEVSRKLEELGYHRNPKKCKEKFENIYKYHKRTKESRSDRPNTKTYRFFEQLQALDTNPPLPPPPPPPSSSSPHKIQSNSTETTATVTLNPTNNPPPPPCTIQNPTTIHITDASTSTTSSSGGAKEYKAKMHQKKRKMSDFFERLMKEVIEKQESLQNKFIEAVDKYERDRMAREEAWKVQEMARIKREHDLLVQERSIAAAKDAAVLAFLQKYSPQTSPSPVQFSSENLTPAPVEKSTFNNYGSKTSTSGPSRWPKAEVEALIRLRTNFDQQYQENGPKGPLWEEISSAMKKIGYNRNAKRCKEKWENINKYFKRVKESNKKRPEDSKTCPYFHQLDAIYKEKSKKVIDDDDDNNNNTNTTTNTDNSAGYNFKPEDLLMQMVGHNQKQGTELVTEEGESENVDDQNEEEEEEENGEDDDQEDGDEEEDDERDNYRIVANDDPSSMAIMG